MYFGPLQMPTGVSRNLKMIGMISMWESLSTSLCRSKQLKDMNIANTFSHPQSLLIPPAAYRQTKYWEFEHSQRGFWWFLLKRIYSLKLKQNRKFQRKKPCNWPSRDPKKISQALGPPSPFFAPEQIELSSIQSYGGMATPPRIVGQILCRFESLLPFWELTYSIPRHF